MKSVLTIDLGASSGRAMLAKFDGNKITLQELHRFSNDPVMVNGKLFWDILRLWHEIKQGMIKAHNAGGFDSIGIDAWGVDFALVDEHGDLVENAIHYRDIRTNGMIEKLQSEVPFKQIYEHTGIQDMQLNTIYQIYSLMRDRKYILNRSKKLLFIPDVLNYFLTGIMVSEYTEASTSALIDPYNRCWDRELINRLSIPDVFCELVEPGALIGRFTPELEEELGFNANVIAVASHDTASAIVAVPEEKDFVYISSGTWSLMGCELKEPSISDITQYHNFTNEGGYNNSVCFLKNIMGLWIIQESRRQWQKEGHDLQFTELVQMAEKADPFKCIFDVDDTSLLSPGNLPERIREICIGEKPATIGEVSRSIFESLALKYRKTYQEIQEATGKTFSKINIVGGGANNALLNQFTANAINVPVVAGPVEATVLGNAAVQFIASGDINSLEQVRRIIKKSSQTNTFMPQEQAGWDEAFKKYLKL